MNIDWTKTAVEMKCPLCGAWIALKPDKHNRPNGFCRCGLQIYLRRQEAIELLAVGLKEKKADFVRQRSL